MRSFGLLRAKAESLNMGLLAQGVKNRCALRFHMVAEPYGAYA